MADRDLVPGGVPQDPAFAALRDVVQAPMGETVEQYARPLSAEQLSEYHRQLDEVEPAHMKAVARLRTLFAG